MSDNRFDFLYARVFPELKLFPDVRVKKEALRRATCHVYYKWYNIVLFVASVIIIIKAKFVVRAFVDLPFYMEGALVGLTIGLTLYILIMLSFKTVRRNLREYLNSIEIPICIFCGYQLHGACSERCPECGLLHGRS